MNALCKRLSALLLLVGLTSAAAQEIKVWSGYPEMEPYYKRVGDQLKAKYPNLKVSVEAIPLREHEKRMALTLPTKSAADILEMSPSTAARYLEANLIPQAPSDVANMVKNTKMFDRFFLTGASYKNTVYGMPLFRGQSALYYNTDMFKAAGLDGPPKTMADYTKYARQLTQRGANNAPTVSGWSMRLSGGGEGIAEKFWINMHQYGGAILKATKDGKWIAGYDNAAGRLTLKQYLDLVHTYNTVNAAMKADAEAFELKQTAMFIRESWVIGDIEKKAKDLKYATAPLPRGAIALPVNLYVTSGGANGQAAWDFAKAAVEPANLVWLLDNVGWLPNRKDVDYRAVIKKTPGLNGFLNYPKNYQFFTLPAIGPISEILTRFAERLTRAYNDPTLAKDPAAQAKFLKDAADETNSILKREGLLGTP